MGNSTLKERLKEIKLCVKNLISAVRKKEELNFNKNNYHTSGRSGMNGQKFIFISQAIYAIKANSELLSSYGCHNNDSEKKIVIEELRKHAIQFRNRANGINHLM